MRIDGWLLDEMLSFSYVINFLVWFQNGKETVTTEPAVLEVKKPSAPNQETLAAAKPAGEDEQSQANSVAEKKAENKGDKKSPEAEVKSEQDLDEECDMSGSYHKSDL